MTVPSVKLKDGRTVFLGANIDREKKAKLHFADYYDPAGASTPPPAKTTWGQKAAQSISGTYGNTQEGDCVIASKAHKVGVLTGNDADSGGEVVSTDGECLSEYHRICGPGDNGCNVPDVLDTMQRGGIKVGGKLHKIAGYVGIDPTNKELIKAAIALLGPLDSEIDLPGDWTCTNCIWKATNSRIVGGHDVCFFDYDEQYVYGATWGGIVRVTWDAFTSGKWVQGLYATLSPDWTNADHLSPGGVNVELLAAALAALGGGHVPDVPDPTPTPTPPPPPTPTPPPPGPPGPTPWAWLWALLWQLIDWLSQAKREEVRTKVEALPWAQILALLLQLLEALLQKHKRDQAAAGYDPTKGCCGGGDPNCPDAAASAGGGGRSA